MAEVLRAMGAEVERLDNGDVAVTTPPAGELVPAGPYELFERMRASVVVLGLLLARCGAVRMPLPGGDDFGDRPIDFHINGLTRHGRALRVVARRGARHGAGRPPGRDARRPRVPEPHGDRQPVDGGRAGQGHHGHRERGEGARGGRPGVDALRHGGGGARARGRRGSRSRASRRCARPTHAVVPDRVVAATYLAAVGMAGGEVTIADARPEHMEMLLRKVGQMGVTTEMGPAGLRATRPTAA